MFKALKIMTLYIIKYLGGFWLLRRLNKGNTCVLCYHGFSYNDEYKFRPKLFMRPSTFAQRMRWLKKSNYQVVPLAEAIAQRGKKNNFVVLTLDDGWASNFELVSDVLFEAKLPSTLYVTSYYVKKQGVVVNVALAYILWRSIGSHLVFIDEALQLDIQYEITTKNIDQLVTCIRDKIYHLTDISVRQQVVMAIAEQLNVSLYYSGKLLFRMLNEEELLGLTNLHVSIQLHTHHHCSPTNEQTFNDEVNKNIHFLNGIIPEIKLEHFCYPNGEYYNQQLHWLKKLGVKSATTVSPGMLTEQTNLLKIPRFLDGENVHQVEFEAELCGFTSLYRRIVS